MQEEKELFTPKEAADFLSKSANREITIARLAQLRRAGKVKGTRLGYNGTIYKLEDLQNADVSLSRAGRKRVRTEKLPVVRKKAA